MQKVFRDRATRPLKHEQSDWSNNEQQYKILKGKRIFTY